MLGESEHVDRDHRGLVHADLPYLRNVKMVFKVKPIFTPQWAPPLGFSLQGGLDNSSDVNDGTGYRWSGFIMIGLPNGT